MSAYIFPPTQAAEEAEKRVREENKKQREAQKKALKRERQKLRILNEGSGAPDRLVDDDSLEKLTTKLDIEALASLIEALSVGGMNREQQRTILHRQLLSMETKEEAEARVKEQQKRETEAALKVSLHFFGGREPESRISQGVDYAWCILESPLLFCNLSC